MKHETTHEDIVKWVKHIADKFQLAAPVEYTVGWIENLVAHGVKIVLDDDFYYAYGLNADAWGNVQFCVISACSANLRAFLQMQREIEDKARELKADMIIAGSEIDDRYNQWLVRKGYKPYLYKKEL